MRWSDHRLEDSGHPVTSQRSDVIGGDTIVWGNLGLEELSKVCGVEVEGCFSVCCILIGTSRINEDLFTSA